MDEIEPGSFSPSYKWRYAGIVDRFSAQLVDTAMLFFIIAVFAVPLGMQNTFPPYATNPFDYLLTPIQWLSLPLWFGYYTLAELAWGQTLGKKFSRLKVINARTGGPIGLGRSLVRNSLRLVDWLPFFYFLGILTTWRTSRKQRIGDLVAGTVVIRIIPAGPKDSREPSS